MAVEKTPFVDTSLEEAHDQSARFRKGLWKPDSDGANEEQAKKELDRLHRYGPASVPPLGNRKEITTEEDWLAGDPAYFHPSHSKDEPSAAELMQRQKEWTGHIKNVAAPVDPKDPHAPLRIRKEFRERYPELDGLGEEAFSEAITRAADKLGDSWLNNRFDLYRETAAEMRSEGERAEREPTAEHLTEKGRQLMDEFKAAHPDLAGDEAVIDASARRVVAVLENHGLGFEWEKRDGFIRAVAADMKSQGKGRPAATRSRSRRKEDDGDDGDRGRTQGISTDGLLSKIDAIGRKGAGKTDMLDQLKEMQAAMGIY